MAGPRVCRAVHRGSRPAGTLALLTASLMLGACAQVSGVETPSLFAGVNGGAQETENAAASVADDSPEYWSKVYAKKPRDLHTALAYARSLKAAGQKGQALAVLQDAALLYGSDRTLASEYGRLALELDQIALAKRLLEIADDPSNPDWRVILARGTVLAKEGRYKESIDFFSRAHVIVPDHPSVMNNLALAYTMNGDAETAEKLLRNAASMSGSTAKTRQNLALVLGLQGKYDEAARVGSEGLSTEEAQANADFLRKMVKLEPKPMTPDGPLTTGWETQISEPASAPAGLETAPDAEKHAAAPAGHAQVADASN